MPAVSLPDEVRVACAWVAERARFVRIEEEEVEAYARGLPAGGGGGPPGPPAPVDPEASAAFAICMNAINFGSGWWPTIRKRPGLSGYGTMEAGLRERFERDGPWSPEELVSLDAVAVSEVLGQDPDHPLMEQFALALRDVGTHILEGHGSLYLGIVETADSIPDLAAIFASWSSFSDVSHYEGRAVPVFKRAQIAAADLHRAGVADLPGPEDLTAFADNLVPHVLRVDGVLQLDQSVTARIENEELLEHGSPEEVESPIRSRRGHALASDWGDSSSQ